MSFGFRIFGNRLLGSERVDALNAELDALELEIQVAFAAVEVNFAALKSLAASYGLKPVVFNYNSPNLTWSDAAISVKPDGYLKLSAYWQGLQGQLLTWGVVAIDPTMSVKDFTAAKAGYTANKTTAFVASAYDYEEKIKNKESLIWGVKRANEARRIPIFDSSSIAWSQVDMFLVPAGLKVERSYAGMGFSAFQATLMFVNSHPKDGVGAAGTAFAPLLEVYGSFVRVSGGNRDTYIMVVAQ